MVDVFFFFLRNWKLHDLKRFLAFVVFGQVLNIRIVYRCLSKGHVLHEINDIIHLHMILRDFLVELNQKNTNTSMRFVIWKRYMWVCQFSTFIRSTCSWILLLELWCQLPDTWQMNEQDDQIQIKGLPTAILKGWKSFLSFLKARYIQVFQFQFSPTTE